MDDKLINNCRSLKCGNKTVIKARHQDPGGVTFSASTSGDVTYMQVINTTVVPHIGYFVDYLMLPRAFNTFPYLLLSPAY